LEQLNADIVQINVLKNGLPSKLGEFSVDISPSFFTENTFTLSTVNTKTFILMLANEGPVNFISGSPIQLESVLRDCNKKEFHHIYPKAFLSQQKIPNTRINSLANFTILSRADNNMLGGTSPSDYRKRITQNEEALRIIMKKSLCPENIFHDDFHRFLEERTAVLVACANRLMGIH